MNDSHLQPAPAASLDLRRLNGRVVLVKSSRDRRNPPTGMRGWLEVNENPATKPEVSIAMEFPQMFTTPAHRRTIALDDAALAQLLANEYNGTFEFTSDEPLV